MNTNTVADNSLYGQTKSWQFSWQTFTLTYDIAWEESVEGSTELFKKFLRINNRKKRFYRRDFTSAGYSIVAYDTWTSPWYMHREWLDQNTPNWTRFDGHFVFQTESDAVQFKMRWL